MIIYTRPLTAPILAGEARRIIPPATLAVTIDDVKQQLRLTSDAEIDMVLRLIKAATSYVEDYTGLGLITQTWEQRFSSFPEVVALTKRPVVEVSVIADMTTGSPYTDIAPGVYQVAGIGSIHDATTIRAANGTPWPTTSGTFAEGFLVQYVVGFGDTEDDVPEMIRHALLMLASIWFDNREAPDLAPVHALLADWRLPGMA